MGRRRRAREIALQVLYQIEITKKNALLALEEMKGHFPSAGGDEELTQRLVLGVVEHQKEIDPIIEGHSEHWRLDRMTIIDRNILRMAIYELLYCKDIPPKVTLNEAIDLGKRFGTEESGNFINGLLDRIQNEVIRKPL
ncbi:MAG: transcription antitermination factor NusB [Desulfobacterota bacterium]|nr:transcription antitermination factor NusB [Thermodesulfobacteriota bacterium]